MSPWLHEHGDDVLLDVLVAPKSARSRIVGEHDGRLKIQVTAPRVDGRANDALVRFIAQALDVARVQVEVVGGHSSRRKTIRLAQVQAQRALLKLAPVRG
ncbi:MAG: DUF167 domain-containing protein [Myxococcota bacterium]